MPSWELREIRRKALNKTCPLMCGCCCDEHWRDIWKDHPEDAAKCLHIGKTGCALSRKDRPVACREYLCTLAQAVSVGCMPKKRALELLAECGQDCEEAQEALLVWKKGVQACTQER